MRWIFGVVLAVFFPIFCSVSVGTMHFKQEGVLVQAEASAEVRVQKSDDRGMADERYAQVQSTTPASARAVHKQTGFSGLPLVAKIVVGVAMLLFAIFTIVAVTAPKPPQEGRS